MIGAGGIERVVEIALNRAEKAMFDKSVEAVRGLVDACKAIDAPRLSQPRRGVSKMRGGGGAASGLRSANH